MIDLNPPQVSRAELRAFMERLGLGDYWHHLVTFNVSPDGFYIETTVPGPDGKGVLADEGTNDIALHRIRIQLVD